MKSLRVLVVLLACGANASVATAQTVIDFDNILATCPPNGQVAPGCLVHDEYLAQGVRFDSAGGGVGIGASSNPVSPPHVATATTLIGGFPYMSFVDTVQATFWVNSTIPSTVDYVSITLSNSSSNSTLEAFDLAGLSLGSSSGGASATLTVTFPGQIHSVVIHQGPMAFDDFTFDGLLVSTSAFCFGDGSALACPCSNNGAPGRGCQNSALTGGAQLGAAGLPSLSADTLHLTSSGELPNALSVLLQGTGSVPALIFGDGLRCASGLLKRLYTTHAVNGTVALPGPGDPSISARSAALNDPLAAGVTRFYQIYYRDPDGAWCPQPQGSTYNISSGISATWGP
jgi:hypothetical protein